MMMMNPKAPTKEEAVAPTWVWWDIKRCPVPSGVDARRVGPCIKGALRNLGYTGQITITAIGILSEVPPHVLQKLCSTGIALKHVPTDISGITVGVFLWSWKNPPPANIMLISGERIFNPNLADLKGFGYNIIRSIVPQVRRKGASSSGIAYWLCYGKALQEEEDKCCEMDEHALICSTCQVNDADMRFQDFDSLITHLNSMKHAMKVSILTKKDGLDVSLSNYRVYLIQLPKFTHAIYLFPLDVHLVVKQELQF